MIVFLILSICLSSGSITMSKEINCYNRYAKGANYLGNTSKTTGIPCLKWSTVHSPFVNYHEDHNYCRNPLPHEVERPFCYTRASDFSYEKCDIPICDCRNSTNDLKYNGSIHTTRYGNTCRSWTAATHYQSETANYCRTPLHDLDNGGGPWCYTDKRRWERCNIPVCEGSVCPDLSTYHLLTMDRKSKYQYGEIAIVDSCQIGYIYSHIHKTYLECTSTGTWNDTIPICEEITCQPFILDNNVHGSIQPDLHKYLFNTKVTLSCIPGYTGQDTFRVCQANGQWTSLQAPRCTPINCMSLNLRPHVKSSAITPKFNDLVTLSCEEGYFAASIRIKCYANGSWSSDRPDCLPVPCPPLNNTKNMDPPIKFSGYRFGNTINFQCTDGYALSGPSFITCLSRRNKLMGHWSEQPPLCFALPCPIIKLPVHSFDKDMKESTIYYVDQIVDLKCKHGYNLIGNGTLKCTFKRSSKVVDWDYDDKQICLGVLCPLPNITDNLVLITNKTEFRFGDQTLFDCVGDFELTSQLSATRECIVDENSIENGKWTGETPICQAKAAAKHSGSLGSAVGGGIGAAVIVIVVAVVIVFIIRRRKVPQKNKNEMQHNESTLELNNSNIYSQVAEIVDSHVYGKTRVHHVYFNVHDTIEAEKEQDPAKFKLDERHDVSSMMKRIKTREFLSQVLKEEFSVLSTCNYDSRTTCREKTSSTGTKTDVEQSYENTVATAKYSDEISILFETPLNHISESFWSMVDDRHVETIIFLVKDNELVTEFYPKLDDIFKMKTLEIDLYSSEKSSKNILFLTFNILNKARQTTRQVKMYKTSAWKDSDQYTSVETLCYLLDKTSERNKRPIMIIGSKTSGLPIGGVLSVCLNVLEAIRNDRPFNVLDCAITVKKRSSIFFQNCEIYGLCYKVIENHLDSVNTYDIIT